jgi:hypothetical protein
MVSLDEKDPHTGILIFRVGHNQLLVADRLSRWSWYNYHVDGYALILVDRLLDSRFILWCTAYCHVHISPPPHTLWDHAEINLPIVILSAISTITSSPMKNVSVLPIKGCVSFVTKDRPCTSLTSARPWPRQLVSCICWERPSWMIIKSQAMLSRHIDGASVA